MLFDKDITDSNIDSWKALTYEEDVNGSHLQLAGIVDKSGLVLGMMPHPEGAMRDLTSPCSVHQNSSNHGKLFFDSISYYLNNV